MSKKHYKTKKLYYVAPKATQICNKIVSTCKNGHSVAKLLCKFLNQSLSYSFKPRTPFTPIINLEFDFDKRILSVILTKNICKKELWFPRSKGKLIFLLVKRR